MTRKRHITNFIYLRMIICEKTHKLIYIVMEIGGSRCIYARLEVYFTCSQVCKFVQYSCKCIMPVGTCSDRQYVWVSFLAC